MADDVCKVYDEDAILRDSASLRLMVRALLRDDASADDVVQETWLTAMRKSPRPGFEPMAWLRGIARNVIRTTRRTDARRTSREAQAARSELVPSASESAMKLERLRELLGLVSGLREPIRHTLVLRYLDGLMPREIADRLSLPVATVKARLHTGLELLREALDERHGGRRSEWRLAFASLLPELSPAGATASAASLATVLAGGLLVKTTLAFLVVIAAIVILALQLSSDRSAEKKSAGATGRHAALDERAPQKPDRKTGTAPISGAAFDPALEGAAASAPADFRVLVVEKASGAPVTGARVRMWDRSAYFPDAASNDRSLVTWDTFITPADSERVETISDAAGNATFPTRPKSSRLIAETDRLWGQAFHTDGATPQVRIEMEPDLTLRVRVVDAAGAPVGGVPVRLTRFHTQVPPIDFAYGSTADDGLFTAHHIQVNRYLATQAQSFSARLGATFDDGNGVLFDLERLPNEPVTLRLPPTARLTVNVTDRDGNAFDKPAYVGVKVREPPPKTPYGGYREENPHDWRNRTCWVPAKDGRAAFPFVGVGATFMVKVHVLDQEHDVSSSDVEGPTTPGEDRQIAVRIGESVPVIVGRLVDASKQPLKHHYVFLAPQGPTSVMFGYHDTIRTRSDASGALRVPINGVPWRPAPPLRLGFKAFDRTDHYDSPATHYAAMENVPAGPGSNEIDLGEIVMQRVPVLVAGSVRDDAGQPIPGAMLCVELRRPEDPRQIWDLPGLQSRTRADGSFAIAEPCDAGELRLTIDAPGYPTPPAREVARGDASVSIVLPRRASLEGSLLLPDGVLPRDVSLSMEGACVPPHPEGQATYYREMTTARSDGTFVIDGLRGGPGALVVATQGGPGEPRMTLLRIDGIEIAATGTTRDPRARAIDLRDRICVRTITVVDSDGRPVGAARVSFRTDALAQAGGDPRHNTGIDGRAVLIVRREPLTVSVAKEGWLTQTVPDVDSDLRVTLERGITLEIAVTSDVSLPVWPENLRIELERNETRQGPDAPQPVEKYWSFGHALVDPKGVATIEAPFTGPARLSIVANRFGRTDDLAVLPIEIAPAPSRQRIAWPIPGEALRKR